VSTTPVEDATEVFVTVSVRRRGRDAAQQLCLGRGLGLGDLERRQRGDAGAAVATRVGPGDGSAAAVKAGTLRGSVLA
jgi:hypothetical protein